MYVEIIPPARPVRTRVTGTRGKADDGSCSSRVVHGAGGRGSAGRERVAAHGGAHRGRGGAVSRGPDPARPGPARGLTAAQGGLSRGWRTLRLRHATAVTE